MSQVYHSNARINQYVRGIIQESHLTNTELADKYNVNVGTISKWKNRNFVEGDIRENKEQKDFIDLSQKSLLVIWDNNEDAIYDKYLKI